MYTMSLSMYMHMHVDQKVEQEVSFFATYYSKISKNVNNPFFTDPRMELYASLVVAPIDWINFI